MSSFRSLVYLHGGAPLVETRSGEANNQPEPSQIMDSKMDSGYLGPGENQTQALEDDYDVTRELSAEEVLGVMDELICYEVRARLFLQYMYRELDCMRALAEILFCCGGLDGMA